MKTFRNPFYKKLSKYRMLTFNTFDFGAGQQSGL